jgi:hypothetical protein
MAVPDGQPSVSHRGQAGPRHTRCVSRPGRATRSEPVAGSAGGGFFIVRGRRIRMTGKPIGGTGCAGQHLFSGPMCVNAQ